MTITEAEATITAALKAEIAANPELMAEARGWIMDCTGHTAQFWSAARVLNTIDNNYDGGLLSFLLNSN